MQAIRKSWRNSASLITLARRIDARSRVADREDVNYDILLQTRTGSASFPNSVVFPGGVSELADAADGWLSLLQLFGYSCSDFESLHRAGTTITPIFQDNPVQRHITLRITAIRETFEELGLLLCSRARKQERSSGRASVITDIDLKYWQSRVSKNPEDFLSLCKEYGCYPDIWSLHYWSNWLTPVRLPKRFSTAFFVTALENKPSRLNSSSEVTRVEWANPSEILHRPELLIYPPQVYELSRLTHVKELDALIKFAKDRSSYGQDLLFPVVVKTRDGKLQLLPGDELFPSSVDYYEETVQEIDKTILQLREESKVVHRLETPKQKRAQFVFKNYKPENHINMGDIAVETSTTIH